MQVRKYEAATIKEAVDLVKKDLGPDAIILSTREGQKNLGAHAMRKVIVTAAVQEETYQKKRMVEENLTAKQRDLLLKRPVREQRQFINKAFDNLKESIEERRRQLEGRNYASIPDDYEGDDEFPRPAANSAQTRVKAAVADAFKMGNSFMAPAPAKKAPAKKAAAPTKQAAPAAPSKADNSKIDELKAEIQRLQMMVQNMKTGVKSGAVFQHQQPSHPGARYGVAAEMSPMFEKLISEGFEEKMIAELLKNAVAQLKDNAKKKSLLDAWVAKWIYSNTEIVKEKLQARHHVFVGQRGVGKTSTLVKMASHLVIKERKKIAIITSDCNKVGAIEQLRIYAQILNVPFAVWRKGEDINHYINQMRGADHILIDTEGQSLLRVEEIDQLKAAIPYHLGSIRVHLVMSAMMKDEELFSIGRRFKSVNYHDVVLTNIDQLRKHGVLVTLQQAIQVPYFAFSTGSMIPEDFEWASKERVLDLIFKISKTKWEGTKND